VSVAAESAQRAALWDEFTSSASSRFSTQFQFQPLPGEWVAPEMEFFPGDRVAISRSVMPALRLTNYGSSWPDPFLQITRVDQDSTLDFGRRGTLHLAAGEFVVCRPEVAGEWTINRPYTTVAFHVEERLLRKHVPDPATLVGRTLELSGALNDILSRIVDASVALARRGQFAAVGRSLAASFLPLLALSPLADAPEDRVERYAVEFRRAQIKTYIQENYSRPGLSTEDIADHFEITPRYVQMALAPEGLTPSDYLRACRLEAARQLLSSPAAASRTITEIAFECGFASSAHFSTEFRKRFGSSPRSYRQAAPALRPRGA
jgi:AraC-like DNA-binding protein